MAICVLLCRYERTANDMLAKSTIAGQEAVITYLANAAALQQFEQTGLAYVLMHEAGRSMGAAGLAAAAESLLEGKFEVNMPTFTTESCGHHALVLLLVDNERRRAVQSIWAPLYALLEFCRQHGLWLQETVHSREYRGVALKLAVLLQKS